MPDAQSQRMWEADLTEPGRKLTLDELVAMEAMHQCQAFQEIVRSNLYILTHLRSIEERINRLEMYLERVDPRYPKSGQPEALGLILVNGRQR